MSRQQQRSNRLSKFLAYVLGRCPDEFGLVLDANGFVTIKRLLKAINEEPNWKYVRRTHLNEIMLTLPEPSFEIRESCIRAINRNRLPKQNIVKNPPRLLFTCVRRKAHPVIMEKGITPSEYPQIILTAQKELAYRIGRRRDSEPILLTVHTGKTIQQGIFFTQCGESIYLAKRIPPGCFSGPPLPKIKSETLKKKPEETNAQPALPGSFLIDVSDTLVDRRKIKRDRRRKNAAAAKQRKQQRHHKKKGRF